MMKKIIISLLICLMVFSLVSCAFMPKYGTEIPVDENTEANSEDNTENNNSDEQKTANMEILDVEYEIEELRNEKDTLEFSLLVIYREGDKYYVVEPDPERNNEYSKSVRTYDANYHGTVESLLRMDEVKDVFDAFNLFGIPSVIKEKYGLTMVFDLNNGHYTRIGFDNNDIYSPHIPEDYVYLDLSSYIYDPEAKVFRSLGVVDGKIVAIEGGSVVSLNGDPEFVRDMSGDPTFELLQFYYENRFNKEKAAGKDYATCKHLYSENSLSYTVNAENEEYGGVTYKFALGDDYCEIITDETALCIDGNLIFSVNYGSIPRADHEGKIIPLSSAEQTVIQVKSFVSTVLYKYNLNDGTLSVLAELDGLFSNMLLIEDGQICWYVNDICFASYIRKSGFVGLDGYSKVLKYTLSDDLTLSDPVFTELYQPNIA